MVWHIYTDGACKNNPGRGGWAYIVLDEFDQVVRQSSAHVENTTNNKMELTAALEALKYVDTSNKGIGEVTIFVDSKYVYDGITTWINGWKKKNWKTSTQKDVLNQDLWRELDFYNEKHKIKWQWVRAHVGNKWNEVVDKAASDAANIFL